MSTPSDQETAPDAAQSEAGSSEAGSSEVTPDGPPVDPRSRGERFEQSRPGRLVIGLFLAVTLVALVVMNAPTSETKRTLSTVVNPYLSALGLDQGWGVFSPNPRRFSIDMDAEIRQVDGSVKVIPIESGVGLDGYWEYQWRRWADQLANGRARSELWEPYCRWLAQQDRSSGGQPIQVALISRRIDSQTPGTPATPPEILNQQLFAVGVSPR